MSAESVLAAALLAVLRGDAVLAATVNGVFETGGVETGGVAALPFAELGELIAVDWGTKSAAGRELRVGVMLRDAGEAGVRVLAEAAGAAIERLPRDLSGWRVASVVFVRSRVARAAAGKWSALVEYRVRMMAS